MKIQDLAFVIIFILVLLKKDSRIAALAGIACLFISIPLFAFWIFFTAQHLVWYSAVFFALSIIFLFNNK